MIHQIRVVHVLPLNDWRDPAEGEVNIELAENERIISARHTGHRGEVAVYIEVTP